MEQFKKIGYTDSSYLTIKLLCDRIGIASTYSELRNFESNKPTFPNISFLDLKYILEKDIGFKTFVIKTDDIDNDLYLAYECVAYLNVDGGIFGILLKSTVETVSYLHPYDGIKQISQKDFKGLSAEIVLVIDKTELAQTYKVNQNILEEEATNRNNYIGKCIQHVDGFLESKQCNLIVKYIEKVLQSKKANVEKLSAAAVSVDDSTLKNISILLEKHDLITEELVLDKAIFLKYIVGDKNSLHFDIQDLNEGRHKRSVLVYLNTVETGGETYFPELSLKIDPIEGKALVFDSIDQFNKPYPMSIHAGLSVKHGVKYTINLWYK